MASENTESTPDIRKFLRKKVTTRNRLLLCGYSIFAGALAVAYISKSLASSGEPNELLDRLRKRSTDNVTFTAVLLNDVNLPNCTPPAIDQFPADLFSREQRQHGGVLLHFLISLYMFIALAIVCDDYFVSSLESISEKLNLQSDVAGATFMAVGSSAPELFTSVIGVFITEDDVGIGTIVGSAVFNLLCIIALCGLLAGTVINLSWWPLFRDSICYIISILALVVVMADEIIQWYETVFLLILYALYILLMFFNQRISSVIISRVTLWNKHTCMLYNRVSTEEKSPLVFDSLATPSNRRDIGLEEIEMMEENMNTLKFEIVEESEKKESISTANGVITKENDYESLQAKSPSDLEKKDEVCIEENETNSPLNIPDKNWKKLLWIITIPINAVLYTTVPDCRSENWKRWYIFTFMMSTLWIAVFSYILVWMVTVIGDTLNIPDTIMGLTLLAAGTSVPDALASIIVAKDGYGDMAVSNSIGSNIFDILLCLGLPWFIKTVVIATGSDIYIHGAGLTYTALMLLVTVSILLISIALNKWRLDKKLGYIFLLIYAVFMSFAVMYELNVFGMFSLPSCPRP
ncbi:sodium/potassium/calcium exchanger 5-like [Saccoglossus kowalevskii]|uniref:Sodium/potassium/calcium exchanger 3-like n=1 Tax=Saccoglossus kowalevskii TaxID=10224 RepID=A0ABM0MPD2_SACKO|nr:PREDICTED: sodium/potassium/calcium exchanger 3-like [Saccoglossus kowalevskii]